MKNFFFYHVNDIKTLKDICLKKTLLTLGELPETNLDRLPIDEYRQDYICLSVRKDDLQGLPKDKLSYPSRIVGNLSILVSLEDGQARWANPLTKGEMEAKETLALAERGQLPLISSYYDEYVATGIISHKNWVAIGYPQAKKVHNGISYSEIGSELSTIREALETSKIKIPVIDSTHYDFSNKGRVLTIFGNSKHLI